MSSARVSLYYGSYSNSVMNLAIVLCRLLRPYIYRDSMGLAWPFSYDNESNALRLQDMLDTRIMSDDRNVPDLYFSIGSCVEMVQWTHMDIDSSPKAPVIVRKLNKDTSQGKIFIASLTVPNSAAESSLDHERVTETPGSKKRSRLLKETFDIPIVVKADKVSQKQRNWWINSFPPHHLKGKKGVYKVVCEAYMDALCSILLSNLVEHHKSPHFPICYGTSMVNAKVKRSKSTVGSRKQVLWIEYLPQSLFHDLKIERDHRKWWSAIFQVNAGLICSKYHYGFIHNDLHALNVRKRLVPADTILYYVDWRKRYYAVPTFGNVYVIIDFGRSVVKLHGKADGYVSSTFTDRGHCRRMIPDNPSIDLVRFAMSIEDQVHLVDNSEQRKQLHALFADLCKCDDPNFDILQKLLCANDKDLPYYLDELPRTICHNADSYVLLDQMYDRFGVSTIPNDIMPFSLDALIQ